MADIIQLPKCKNLESLNDFLAIFDCNSILSIDRITYMDKPTLNHFEKYILTYSIKVVESGYILKNITTSTIYLLDFLKNMVDNKLLELYIQPDMTKYLIDEHNFNSTIEIFKWYYNSGWEINYDSNRVFKYFFEYDTIDAIKWWYENNLPRDYANLSLHIGLIDHHDSELDYILDIILSDDVVKYIKYFDYITNIVDLEEWDDVLKVTNFCINYGADFTINNIVYDCLFNMEYILKLNPKICDIFEYYILETIHGRELTETEITDLNIYYLFFDYIDHIPKNIATEIENIIVFPIKINIEEKKINNIIFVNLSYYMEKSKNRIDSLREQNKIHIIDKN